MEGSIQATSNGIANQHSDLETSITMELARLSPMSPSRCIFRVPDRLRRVCEEAYIPRVISIGPLHHGKKEVFKAMEEHKKRYLRDFLGRTNNLGLKDYIKKIKDQEEILRSCYSETIEFKSNEFVGIIIVDAIFIIEFLFRGWYPELRDENDCIFKKPQLANDIWPDLLMLENQLPFFILEDLFHLVRHLSEYNILHGFGSLSIRILARHFLNDNEILIGGMLENLDSYELGEEVQHFVDLLRKLYIAPTLNQPSTGQPHPLTAPRIEELHLAGVKFEVGSTNNLFDIRFKDGILKIPKLKTTDATELILRNLVAFEQCSTPEKYYISDYVITMDQFVDTPKDVKLLVENKIVTNDLGGGDDELSTMINSLSRGVMYNSDNFCYGTLCEDLNKFCGSKYHKSMANLRQNYFNTPWATISFNAALLVLILTAIQTICAIISLA